MDLQGIQARKAEIQAQLALRAELAQLELQEQNLRQVNRPQYIKSEVKSEGDDDVVFLDAQQVPRGRATLPYVAAYSALPQIQGMPTAMQCNATPYPSTQHDSGAQQPSNTQPHAQGDAQEGMAGAQAWNHQSLPLPTAQANGAQAAYQQNPFPQYPQPGLMGPPPRAPKPAAEKKPKIPKIDFRPPHPEFPSVVRAPDGKDYVELRCCFCGGNHSTKHRAGTFFAGAAGLANHIRICHFSQWANKSGNRELSNLAVVELCRVKDLDSWSVDQMVRGNKKAYKVPQIDAEGHAEAGTMVTKPRHPRKPKRKAPEADTDEDTIDAAESLLGIRDRKKAKTSKKVEQSAADESPAGARGKKKTTAKVSPSEARGKKESPAEDTRSEARGKKQSPPKRSPSEARSKKDGSEEAPAQPMQPPARMTATPSTEPTDGGEDEEDEDDEPPRNPSLNKFHRRKKEMEKKPVKAIMAARKSAPGGPSAFY